MRLKTSNALYRVFDHQWPNNDLPAVGMTAGRAAEFAAFLGGRLPDPEETDRALGFDPDTPDGPAHAAKAVVNRRGEPDGLPVSRPDPGDVTPDGVVDLCGNGWEYTRGVLDSAVKVGGTNLPPDAPVILRGQSWAFSQPLTYRKLKERRDDPKKVIKQDHGEGGAFTGVRVLLEIP
jgi:formylglycine-generating enzyme required for sulfatase activity